MSIAQTPQRSILYIFLDEAGNLDFSNTGTEYFIISALSMIRPFPFASDLVDLKYDLWEKGIELEYFHATEDTQQTRNEVFKILQNHLQQFETSSIIVEKRKTHPSLQNDKPRFFKTIFDILLEYILKSYKGKFNEVFIVTDTLPVGQKRKDLEKAIKRTLTVWAKSYQTTYHIFHYGSKSDINLQITDYMNWAVFKKWERKDERSYNLIQTCVKIEFDVFQGGNKHFY